MVGNSRIAWIAIVALLAAVGLMASHALLAPGAQSSSQNCWTSYCEYLNTTSNMGNFDWGYCSNANMSSDCSGQAGSPGQNVGGGGAQENGTVSNSSSPEAPNSTQTNSSTVLVEQTTVGPGGGNNSTAPGGGAATEQPPTAESGSGSASQSTLVVTETGLPMDASTVFSATLSGGETQSVSTDMGDTLYLASPNAGGNLVAGNVNYYGMTYVPTVTMNGDGTATVSYSPSAAVLIVANGAMLDVASSSNFQAAITQYQNALASQGLTSLYVDTSSPSYTALTGSPAIPQSPLHTPSYTTDALALQNLEVAAGGTAQYIVILGDQDAFPMQQTSVAGENPNPVNYNYNPSGNPSTIYTDAGYSQGALGTTLAVGRIPGAEAGQVAQFLQNDLNYRDTAQQLTSSYNPLMVTAADSYLISTLNPVSTAISGQPCSSNTNCVIYNGAAAAAGQGGLNSMETDPANPIQVYNGHGNGVWMGSTSGNPTVLTTQTVPDYNAAGMNPIIITQSCFGAALPSQASAPPDMAGLGPNLAANLGPTLATTFLQNGAAAYIGSTGDVETSTASPIAQFFGASSVPQGQVIGYFYNQLSTGMTLGQALQSTQTHFANSGLSQQQVNALSLQLYGDPTLRPFQSPAAHH